MERNYWKEFLKFITNRLFIMYVCVCILFYVLLTRLFTLQIIEGESYLNAVSGTIRRQLSIPAPRGTIYDRLGRPLAINNTAFTIKFDPSIQVDNLYQVLSDLAALLEANGEKYVDDFPISVDEPYMFLFNDSKERERVWKTDMGIPKARLGDDAENTFHYLREKFDIPETVSNAEARNVLSLISKVHLQRYRQYQPVTIAYGVSQNTISAIEEESERYSGVYTDVNPLRIYPAGIYFSHMLGYIGGIPEKDAQDYKAKGYAANDIVGLSGLEKAFEQSLVGTKGDMFVEVNNVGRRVRVIDETLPVQGNKIFLTLDLELQKKAYNILEGKLTDIIKNKMLGLSSRETPITQKQVFASLVKGNVISIKKIINCDANDDCASVKKYILSRIPDASISTAEGITKIKEAVMEGINGGQLTSVQMLLVMIEQQIINGDDTYKVRLKNGTLKPLQVIFDKLDARELTPQMLNLDPSTGSVVVVDVKTGSVLAAVSYPSYDNNEFVNNFNNEYYIKVQFDDPTRPVVNRPFNEPRAPGSTFKMLPAITGLEEGVITPSTQIYDEHTFTKVGIPYTSCWSASSHGSINVAQALEVSCNYFFCETAYRLGNAKNGSKYDAIGALNKYMTAFGLNDRSGVEIGEHADIIPSDVLKISSPSLKEYLEKSRNPDVAKSQWDWYDGDTVKSSIGQANNNYTAAVMAKYIATIASRGTRYKLHLVDGLYTPQGELVKQYEPVVENVVALSTQTWDTIIKGMTSVIVGSYGTGRTVFKDFPVKVAGKTGTAQENLKRNDHSSFGGFTPINDPQIAIYVQIPFGDTQTTPASASQVARDVIAAYIGLDATPERPAESNTLVR